MAVEAAVDDGDDNDEHDIKASKHPSIVVA